MAIRYLYQDLVTVFDAILTRRQMRNYSVCMRI